MDGGEAEGRAKDGSAVPSFLTAAHRTRGWWETQMEEPSLPRQSLLTGTASGVRLALFKSQPCHLGAFTLVSHLLMGKIIVPPSRLVGRTDEYM